MKNYILFALVTSWSFFANIELVSQVSGTPPSNLINEGGYVQGITLARGIGLVELAAGVSSLILALLSTKNRSKKRAKIALTLGGATILLSVIHFAITSGAIFGSGSGKAGAIIAMIFGLVGVIMGYRTLRSTH